MQRIVIEFFLRPLSRLISRLYFRFEVFGLENVPATGSVILAPNHVSYADPIWAAVAVERRVNFMTWERVFRIPVAGWLLRFLGAFPVKLDRFDRGALDSARTVLESGKVLMMFPEGRRTVDGFLQPFKPGVSRLALTTGTKIVPITINGGYEAWPPHRLLPRSRKVTITYHPPITVKAMDPKTPPYEVRDASRGLSLKLYSEVASSLDSRYLHANPVMLSSESENDLQVSSLESSSL